MAPAIPRSRAVPAVMGPITAAANRPDAATGSPTSSTKPRTVDEEVNVTASIVPARISAARDRKSTRLNSSHGYISYAVFCLKKKKKHRRIITSPHSPTGTVLAAVARSRLEPSHVQPLVVRVEYTVVPLPQPRPQS